MAELTTEPALGVKVPIFEGPLELLLNLIRENKIDIYDIPISDITRQYLETLDLMRSLNLSIAGEFLVMAATLIHIKSKIMLPVHEEEEEENSDLGEDPRLELVVHLLEYKKFKEAASTLETRESLWRQIFSRAPRESDSSEVFIGDISPFDLLGALQKVIARLPNSEGMTIENDDLSVRDQIGFILSKIERTTSILFDQLFEEIQTRTAVVVTFLALLEVVRLGLIKIVQVEMCGALRLIGTDNLLKKEGEHGRS